MADTDDDHEEAPMYNSAEEGVATIERMVAQAQERAVKAQKLSAEMDLLRVTGQSRDGSAQVTLTQTGAIADLHLDEQRLGQASLSQIKAAVLEANTNAQAQITERVVAMTAEAFGEGSETTQHLSQQYAEMFPPVAADDDDPVTGGTIGGGGTGPATGGLGFGGPDDGAPPADGPGVLR